MIFLAEFQLLVIVQASNGVIKLFLITEVFSDFPNSWPPEMGFLILGLLKTNNSAAITKAHELIEKYVINCYCGF